MYSNRKNLNQIKILVLINIIICIIFMICFVCDFRIIKEMRKYPIDYELKNIDECNLTIHNFVSFKSKLKKFNAKLFK